ncbi:unnamed protein product [Closterium sp. NIES-65]|nr:unnamed protein product [Closterium sp. NIES-65]
MRESSVPYVILGNEGKLLVKGEGELVLQGQYGELKLENVLYVDGLALNLISQSQLDSTGCKTFSDKGKMWVFDHAWNVIAKGMRNDGLYEMKLNEKVLAAEKATYQPPPKEGVMAREELKAKLKGVLVEELQVEAVAMVAAAAKVDLETLHRRLGHAGMERIKELVKKGMAAGVELKEGDGSWVIKDVEKGKTAVTRDAIFYEDVNSLQWKGVNQEIATGAAAALDKVEKLLVEKENEGIGCDEEETEGGADKPTKEPIFSEPAKKRVVEAVADVEEEGRHEGELGETCAEEETQSVEDVENSDGSAKEDGSSPWKLIDSDATCEGAKEINELLEDGAIVIGKERGLDEIYAATKEVKQIPRATLFLGMNQERNVEEKKLFLYQKKYCNRVQQRFGQGLIKEITTPLSGMAANDTEQEEDVKQWGGEKKALQMYQSMVGSVMYPVACTKADMAYAASYLGQHVQQGRKWREMKRALSYLVQHEDEGLLFEGGEETLQLVGTLGPLPSLGGRLSGHTGTLGPLPPLGDGSQATRGPRSPCPPGGRLSGHTGTLGPHPPLGDGSQATQGPSVPFPP